jgi:hypothetical protein
MHTTHVLSTPHASMVDVMLVSLDLTLHAGILRMKLAVFVFYVEPLKLVIKLLEVGLQYWIKDCLSKFELYTVVCQHKFMTCCGKCMMTQH